MPGACQPDRALCAPTRCTHESAAVGELALGGSPSRAGLRGDQVTGRRRDGCSRWGRETRAEIDELVRRTARLEQSWGSSAGGQLPAFVGRADQDKARSSSAGGCHGGN